jgi:hypothetical protein
MLEFTVESRRDLSYREFDIFCTKYKSSLENYPFKVLDIRNDLSIFKALKREAIRFGPYDGLTVFESVNRISSDLVLLRGVRTFIQEGDLVTIRLGNEHFANEGDFVINGKHGEVFNVAPSFFHTKLRNTLSNWRKKEKLLSYVLFNGEVLEYPKCKTYFNYCQTENLSLKFIPVYDWDKP